MERPHGIAVLIADDEHTARSFLRHLIDHDPALRLAGSAASADEAVRLARTHRPDVALVDVRMPGSGEAAVRGIRAASPHTTVVAFSASTEREGVLGMLEAGAEGYVTKETTPERILETLRAAAAGEATLSSDVAVDVLAELARRLRVERAARDDWGRTRSRITRVIEGGCLTAAYQPIVHLGTGRVAGVEALARFHAQPSWTPERWFAEAGRVGLRGPLEIAAAEAAIAGVTTLPKDLFVAINLSPEVLASRSFAMLLERLPAGRFVVEVTEHAAVDDYGDLDEPIRRVRRAGGRLAIDDAGAGFASLRHVVRLRPDIVKIDRALTRDVAWDPTRRALARSLVSFSREAGFALVAEGIEWPAELATLRELGVGFGQGFLLGVPEPQRTVDLSTRDLAATTPRAGRLATDRPPFTRN